MAKKNYTKAQLEGLLVNLLGQAEGEGIYDKVCSDGQRLINEARVMVGMEKLPEIVEEDEICIYIYPKKFSIQGDPLDQSNYEVSLKVEGSTVGIGSIDIEWH
jgi:hypothetical protein